VPDPPNAVVPPAECGPEPDLANGPVLDCEVAVAAAIASLEEDLPPIVKVRFDYGPCTGPDPNAAYDCFVQQFGTVTIEFLGQIAKPIAITVTGTAESATVTGTSSIPAP
jgi:hypothetical protein